MKRFFLLFILSFSALYSQEEKDKVIYVDSLHKESNEFNFHIKTVIKDYYQEKDIYELHRYDRKNNLLSTSFYKDKELTKQTGLETEYYKNGNKKSEKNYFNNQLHGIQTLWYENGSKHIEKKHSKTDVKVISFWDENGNQTVVEGEGKAVIHKSGDIEHGSYKNGLKTGKWEGTHNGDRGNYTYEEEYENGKLIKGFSIDQFNKKSDYNAFFINAEPVKGLQHFYKYVASKAKPKKKITGKIILTFIVTKDGYLKGFNFIKGTDYETEEEIIKVLAKYPKWNPGRYKRAKRKYAIYPSYNTPKISKAAFEV